MRLTVRLCAAVAAAMGVVVAVKHVEQREVRNNRRDVVSPLGPEESLTRVRNRRLSSETRGRQWARRNIYSRHYTQEEPDSSATYWDNQRFRRRYHSLSGGPEARNLHSEVVTEARHESRALQAMRINTTGFPIVRASVRYPSPVSRTRTTEDERFSSRVHQAGLQTSTNDRRRFPHARASYEARVPPTSRDRFQRPPPERRDEIHNRVSYDSAWAGHTSSTAGRGGQVYSGSLATSSRPVGRPAHHRHRAPNTQSNSAFTSDPSTAATTTRGLPREPDAAGERLRTQHSFSEISDEVENDLRQRLDQPDLCCGSRVPFDPRVGRPTGGFQRVASAGSIKVVELPAQNSFPPSEVRDLRAAPLDPHTLSLTWTAPGEDLDSGTVSGYIIRLSEARHYLQESQFDAAPEETLLDTSETLTAAGVYQAAGTRVGVEVPLLRQLQRGHVYYVALKALDSDGYSSGVSNVARFSIPESSTDNNTAASHGTTTANHAGADPRVEEAPGTSSSRESILRNGEMTVFSERSSKPPATRVAYTASEPEAGQSSGRNSEEQSVLSASSTTTSDASEPEGSENQRKRSGRKDRRRKKNKKSKRRRKNGRRNGRRRDSRRREENSDTFRFGQDSEECAPMLPSDQQEREPISLCEAQYSLAIAITYFAQNNEHHYLDYLSAALHTLEQKMQPSWRTEPRVRRSGGLREMRTSMPGRHP